MIGEALRIEIEAYAARRDDIPVFRAAARGEMTIQMARAYVTNLGHMISLTPPYMRQARDRAMVLGDERLSAFFANKVRQEEGHIVWAEQDLRSLERREHDGEPDSSRVMVTPLTKSVKELAAWLTQMIDENPVLYLPYIAFAEYTTVIIGPAWLDLLEQRCGIPRAAMTVIDNHVELDRAHAEEAFACIDDFVTDPKMLAPMRAVLAKTIEYFTAICTEIVEMGAGRSPTESRFVA